MAPFDPHEIYIFLSLVDGRGKSMGKEDGTRLDFFRRARRPRTVAQSIKLKNPACNFRGTPLR
uniref:Uncharacterized protein n=1 Tax=Marseillevirus LCMAC103 TaxID=2506604 RepID=A0A481YUJ4_9VIRU|nr:MAG: hypothetical protein LCMAC103_01900 [Marseillevirus LCMAC103]